MIEKGKVLDIKGKKVVVEVKTGSNRSIKKVGLRDGVEIKKGNEVMIAFGVIIDKV